eukprot:7448982-Pyramimonas_sp.AAC.1
MTSFYGSSCANYGKGALNNPETIPHLSIRSCGDTGRGWEKGKGSERAARRRGTARARRECPLDHQ